MKKFNLPVILLKGLVLLPQNHLKLEFDSKNNDNSVIDMSISFHNSYLLLSCECKKNNIAVLSRIENYIKLPNGNVRIDIKAIRRVRVLEYLTQDEPLESIAVEIDNKEIDLQIEQVYIKKIKKELNSYIKHIPYISNSVLSIIENENNLDKLIDLIAPNLSLSNDDLLNYLNETNTINRAELLLKDIYNDSEMFKIDKSIDMKIKKQIDETQKQYLIKEKIKLLKEELDEDIKTDDEIEKLKERIDDLVSPDHIKTKLLTELNRYEKMPSLSPEIGIIKDYIEWLLSLPWCKSTVDNDSLKKARKILDETHYGLDEVKNRIIEYLAVKKLTNSLKGPIICLVGPPGVGKTSLAYSIAKAINRNFAKISVNGMKDQAEIIGHRRTYIGASPGRIISSLKKVDSNNPVILIDEIDKISSDYKSDPTDALINILDIEQNKYFSDNYIEEEFDLSNCLFILTANNIDNIKAPLKDRLEIIELSGYTEFQKVDIAVKHLIPKLISENGLQENFIEIKDEIILKIIRNYTKESGIRELERQLNKIIRKVVTQIVSNNIKIAKISIDDSVLEKYLGKEKYQFNKKVKEEIGVVNGLAYTEYGGDILPIEVNLYPGKGDINLTGNLGDILKESAKIALSYLKSNYKKFKINYDLFKNDIHIHIPEGAIKKDGPSAGIALTLALLSSLTNMKIKNDLALTGEITLKGRILPIGGLKEKSIGALRSGIKKIIIPFDNIDNLEEIPKEVKDSIEYIPVKTFDEILKVINHE